MNSVESRKVETNQCLQLKQTKITKDSHEAKSQNCLLNVIFLFVN